MLAASALAFTAPAHAASLTGEDVTLNLDPSGTTVTVYATNPNGTGKSEVFRLISAVRDSTPPETAQTTNASTAGAAQPGTATFATPSSGTQTYRIVAQGGGPVLDTFYVNYSCTAGSCVEVAGSRDMTSHP